MKENEQSVLLIVDAQVGVLDGTWNTSEVVENILTALEKARLANIPVVWVQHDDDELIEGSDEWKIVDALTPLQGEAVLAKHFNSAFEQSSLQQILTSCNATHIVLAGAATNWCIRATAHAALERGYDLTLLEESHTTEDMQMLDGTTLFASNMILELNVAIEWMNYPDRKNDVVLARDVVFRGVHN